MSSLQAITEIDVDFSLPNISVVHAKQYDTVRKVMCNLYDHGVKWYAPESDYYALVSYKKSDKIGGFYDITETGETAVTVDEDRSVLYIVLDRNVVTTSGLVRVDVTFYDTITNRSIGSNQEETTGKRLSTFTFTVDVEEATITELDLASNPYFNVLAENISSVLHVKENLARITATTTTLASNQNATISVTGGPSDNPSEPDTPYVFGFGIPRGRGVNGNATQTQYGVTSANDDEETLPTEWVSDITSLVVPEKSIIWSKVILSYDDGYTSVSYMKAYQGEPGPAGVAVQSNAPTTNVKVWIDPTQDQTIVIPDIRDNTVSNDSTYSSSKIEDLVTTNTGSKLELGDFLITSVTICSNKNINGNDKADMTVTTSNAGYYPLGVVGCTVSGDVSTYANIPFLHLSSRSEGSATIRTIVRNLATSNKMVLSMNVKLLWIKIR